MSCDRRSAQAMPAGPPPMITTSASICGRSTPSRGLRKTRVRIQLLTGPSCLLACCRRAPRLGALGLLDLLNQGRDDVEQVADDSIIGNLKDGRLGILVDGDDGSRTFHAHNVLDGAADAERQVELGSDGLAG